jgi:hypothetical protein
MSPDFILQLIIGVAAAAGVYAAIKSDLTRAILTAERAQLDATDAHKRLNTHIETHHERRVTQ